jgi:uncharacterized protein CbrC (UPF0167 family)
MTKDTEFGMVSWTQAVQGVTNGVPGLETTEFEVVLVYPEDGVYGARIPREHLFELLRTPTYTTWQGEQWLFCCKLPMTYIGEWSHLLKSPQGPDDHRSFFESAIDPDEEQTEWLWESLSKGYGSPCMYLFRCKTCGRHRSHWDID